jgi:hypothetical protein
MSFSNGAILHFRNIILLPFFIYKLTLLTCYQPVTTTFIKLLSRLDPMSKDAIQAFVKLF